MLEHTRAKLHDLKNGQSFDPNIHVHIHMYMYCVYRDCHGWSSIIAIHKEILVFTFSFNLNLSSKDIKEENM